MASVTEWIARLVDGTFKRRTEAGLVKYIEPGTLESLSIETDHPVPALRRIQVNLDPSKGNHAHVFTRVLMGTGDAWGGGVASARTPIIEVIPDPAEPTRFVRVCIGPEGILITTRDEP